MIITKTPFRVSFCGGGSDLENFYREHEGCVLSTSINKYMYISIHPYFDKKMTALKYSQNEIVNNISDIKHSIFKCVLNEMNIHGVEIVSTADVPCGTGLGSSSSFTVGLLHALNIYLGKAVSKKELSEMACDIEISKLGNPIGKQDQYAAAFGGFNFITFRRNGEVIVEPLIIKTNLLQKLQRNLLLFYTGMNHCAKDILEEQKKNIVEGARVNNLKHMCRLAKDMRYELEHDQIDSFGEILNEEWMKKKELADSISRPEIDDLYNIAMKNGASGGKLLGAGGGGFLIFYCEEDKQRMLKEALGLEQFMFKFEEEGSSVVYIGDKYW